MELRAPSDPEDDRWRLLDGVSSFLRNAAQVQPLVLVLEDLHWADSGTLDLLRHVARSIEGTRLLLVGTYRDVEVDRAHPLSGDAGGAPAVAGFQRIPMRGLTVDEVHRMYEVIRGNSVPLGQAEAVYQATEGNPLFAQEILRYLVEEGIVVRQDGQYIAQGDAAVVPEGLRDIVGQRLALLGQEANDILMVAAVIGRDFSLDVLERVVDLTEDELLTALEEAIGRSVIEERPGPGTLAFHFTHAVFRELLYDEMSAPRRVRRHQQIAHALEDLYADTLNNHAAELAEHFAQSAAPEDLTKAVTYGEVAARRAQNVYAHGEAVRHLEQALRAQDAVEPDDGVRRCDLLLALGESLVSLAEYERILNEVVPAALELAEHHADSKRAFAACNLALESTASDMTPRSAYWLELAERHMGDDPRGRAMLNYRKAMGFLMSGYDSRATEVIQETLEIGRRLNDPNMQFEAWWLLIVDHSRTLDAALKLIKELDSRSREGIRPVTLSFALLYMTMGYVASGERGLAEERASELEALASRSHFARGAGHLHIVRRYMEIIDGRLEQSSQELPPMFVAIYFHSLAASYLGSPQPRFPSEYAPLVLRLNNAVFMSRDGDVAGVRKALPALLEAFAPREDAQLEQLTLLLEMSLRVDDGDAIERLMEVIRSRHPTEETLICVEAVPRPVFRLMGVASAFIGRPEEARVYLRSEPRDVREDRSSSRGGAHSSERRRAAPRPLSRRARRRHRAP